MAERELVSLWEETSLPAYCVYSRIHIRLMRYRTQVGIIKETCQHIGFDKMLLVCDTRFLGCLGLAGRTREAIFFVSYRPILAFQ
jgi:hypothetical protein